MEKLSLVGILMNVVDVVFVVCFVSMVVAVVVVVVVSTSVVGFLFYGVHVTV